MDPPEPENNGENSGSDMVDVEDLDVAALDKLHTPEVNNTTKKSPNQKLLRLPLARIKAIMKMDPQCEMISQESAVLVTKATELFIEFLTKEAAKQIGNAKRKTVLRRDVDTAIDSCSTLCFLDGALE